MRFDDLYIAMKRVSAVVVFICAAGCQTPRSMQLCRVIDDASLQPISGARVHIQPYAPIHPFWPAGATGITDANGEVSLSLPTDFWFYFTDVQAQGYSEPNDRACPYEQPGMKYASFLFCMHKK